MNSCDKGKRGERMLCADLRALGFPDARRSQQHCGAAGDADLCAEAVPGYHVECKNLARIAAIAFHDQAKRDASEGVTPLVIMRQNRSGWYAMLTLADFADLYHKANRPDV